MTYQMHSGFLPENEDKLITLSIADDADVLSFTKSLVVLKGLETKDLCIKLIG